MIFRYFLNGEAVAKETAVELCGWMSVFVLENFARRIDQVAEMDTERGLLTIVKEV